MCSRDRCGATAASAPRAGTAPSAPNWCPEQEGVCRVFRRRRSEDVGRNWPNESEDGQGLADDEPYDEPAEDDWPAEPPRAEGGPWDAGETFPARERVDLGSLQVPMGPEHEIQLVMADQIGVWVTIRHGESEMQ